MITKQDRNARRQVRQVRVRKNVHGTPERPRLNVFRSNQNIYAQLIDDTVGKTLVAASTLDPEVKGRLQGTGGNTDAAKIVGEVVAKRAVAAGITVVVFDRAGYLYHGRVAALADAAREAGLQF